MVLEYSSPITHFSLGKLSTKLLGLTVLLQLVFKNSWLISLPRPPPFFFFEII